MDDPMNERLRALSEAVASADGPDDAAIASARRRIGEPRRRPARARGYSAPGYSALAYASLGLAAVAIALLAWRGLTPDATPLTYRIDGSAPAGSHWLSTPTEPAELAFSEGTRVVIATASRARVSALEPDGATLQLEQGSLHAWVVHRDTSRWEVQAGPYVVRVTGTELELEWDAEAESLRCAVEEGAVSVQGGLLREPRTVVAGEELRIRRGELVLRAESDPRADADGDRASAQTDEPAPSGAFAEADGPGEVPREAPSPATESPATESPATESPASGGVDRSEVEALYAAADRARYAGRLDEAARVLTDLRARGERGRTSFLLGRVTLQRGDDAQARMWFARYTRESPRGALVEPAMGRILEIDRRAGGPSARASAERYLARFPEGAHAPLARSILDARP
ncbi:MAG: FecR domain-containing protein [Sandaracinaceae bacterium]